MLKIGELERLDLNMLAMYCQRVAESREATYLETEQARRFKTEWVSFIGHTSPRIPELENREDIGSSVEGLKQRVVSFLAGLPMDRLLARKPDAASQQQALRAGAGIGK